MLQARTQHAVQRTASVYGAHSQGLQQRVAVSMVQRVAPGPLNLWQLESPNILFGPMAKGTRSGPCREPASLTLTLARNSLHGALDTHHQSQPASHEEQAAQPWPEPSHGEAHEEASLLSFHTECNRRFPKQSERSLNNSPRALSQ